MKHQWVALPLSFMLALPAAAEIYEWRDSDGNRHFTNSMIQVPAEQQGAVRVIVAEPPLAEERSRALEKAAPPCTSPAAQPPQAETVYDYSGYREAYAAGLEDALVVLATERHAGRSGTVQINGPLAVNNTNAGGYGGFGGFGAFPWYYPFVTTGFDRGRSRFLTMRLLLQDQFQLDRNGPFAFERFPQIGIGPGLDPFLPRGLNPPHAPVYGGRVLFR